MALILTFLLGLFFVAGVIIIRISKRPIIEHISISVALGAMFALLVLELLPEIFTEQELISPLYSIGGILAGAAALKLLDTFVPEHDAHDENNDDSMIHIGIMSAIAISLHNILEGMTVYNIAIKDLSAGMSLGVGVGLHNIPMGMLIYATLKREKGIKKYGVIAAAVLSTFVGGCLMALMSLYFTEAMLEIFVCVTVGMVLYIVLLELFPSVVKHEKKMYTAMFVALGFILVALSALFE